MRICDLTTLYIDGGEGGVNTYLLEKARYLQARPGASHIAVVPGERDERRELFGSVVYTLRSPSLPSNPQHRVLTRFAEVRRILRAESPDIIEVDCAYLLGQVATRALTDAPVIGFYHVHLPTFIARPRASRFGWLFAGAAERATWRYVDYCNRACDRLVVTSHDMYRRLARAGFDGRLELVPLGVNLELFRPRADAASVREDRPTELLYVGRLSREKDLATLLAAFALLPDPERWRLTLVGDGPVRADLEAQADGDPRVRFLGMQPYGEGLAALYSAADLLVQPSPNETFNLTVLEGLASGLPVVAIRQGGPQDLVSEEVGALANPGDPADLALQIEALAARRIPPAVCRRFVEERFPWERSFDRLLAVYERALAHARLVG